MTEDPQKAWFEGIDEVVSDPLRFKAKLRIGSDAYDSSRAIRTLSSLWHSTGAAVSGALVAQSAPVASTFFAPAGILAFLGIGTAATPIGWVVASAALAGAGWVGVMRYFDQALDKRSTTIPDFINTPMDVLALALFDLMAPITLKLASVDGEIDPTEREAIERYFVNEWGYNSRFIEEGMAFGEGQLPELTVEELAEALAELKKSNKDCNYQEMTREFVAFLREVTEADGRIDPAEKAAIEQVQSVFNEARKSRVRKTAEMMTRGVSSAAEESKRTVGQVARKIRTFSSRSKSGKS